MLRGFRFRHRRGGSSRTREERTRARRDEAGEQLSDEARTIRRLLRGRYVVTDPSALPARGMVEDAGVLIAGGKVEEVAEWRVLIERCPDRRRVRFGATPGAARIRQRASPRSRTLRHPARHTRRLSRALAARLLEDAAPRCPPGHPLLEPENDSVRSHYGDSLKLRARMGKDRGGERGTRCAPTPTPGLRVAYAVGFEDRVRLVFGDQAAFLASLPGDLAARAHALVQPAGEAETERYFAFVSELHEGNAANPALEVPAWTKLARVVLAAPARAGRRGCTQPGSRYPPARARESTGTRPCAALLRHGLRVLPEGAGHPRAEGLLRPRHLALGIGHRRVRRLRRIDLPQPELQPAAPQRDCPRRPHG